MEKSAKTASYQSRLLQEQVKEEFRFTTKFSFKMCSKTKLPWISVFRWTSNVLKLWNSRKYRLKKKSFKDQGESENSWQRPLNKAKKMNICCDEHCWKLKANRPFKLVSKTREISQFVYFLGVCPLHLTSFFMHY